MSDGTFAELGAKGTEVRRALFWTSLSQNFSDQPDNAGCINSVPTFPTWEQCMYVV